VASTSSPATKEQNQRPRAFGASEHELLVAETSSLEILLLLLLPGKCFVFHFSAHTDWIGLDVNAPISPQAIAMHASWITFVRAGSSSYYSLSSLALVNPDYTRGQTPIGRSLSCPYRQFPNINLPEFGG